MSAGLRPVSGDPVELTGLVEDWLDGDEALWIRTSGSTGRPKDVVLSPAAVRASATATAERLGGPGQWLLAVPPTGVAGLQVIARSLLAGTAPVTAIDQFTAERRYASLVPTQVHRLLDGGDVAPWVDLDAILVGGAAMSTDLRGRAAEAGLPIVRTYGMSETCGGCVYDGVPLDGVQVRLSGDGRIQISGPVLFDGYVGSPRTEEWFTTGDLGRIEDGVLSVLGRVDDVVISGGVNVALPAVTHALLGTPGVRDAVAVGIDDAEWGQQVVALVAPDGPLSLDALRSAVHAAGHPRSWAPKALVLVDQIPLLPNGKVDRLTARRIAAESSSDVSG